MLTPGTVNLLRDISGANVQGRSGPNNVDDIAAVANGAQFVDSFLYGFDNVTFDRVRTDQYNATGMVARANGGLVTNAVLRVFDTGAGDYNYVTGAASNGDGVSVVSTNQLMNVVALLRAFNGSTLDRVRSRSNAADAIATNTTGNVQTLAYNLGDNGATFDRIKTASAANQNTAATGQLAGIALHAQPGNWPENNFPGAGAQATVTRAAGAAGVRHILTSLHFSLAGAPAAAAASTQCVIRDGASGVGAILWSGVLAAPTADCNEISMSGLSIVGSAATAMTIEFVAGSGAGTQQSVSMTGYDTI